MYAGHRLFCLASTGCGGLGASAGGAGAAFASSSLLLLLRSRLLRQRGQGAQEAGRASRLPPHELSGAPYCTPPGRLRGRHAYRTCARSAPRAHLSLCRPHLRPHSTSRSLGLQAGAIVVGIRSATMDSQSLWLRQALASAQVRPFHPRGASLLVDSPPVLPLFLCHAALATTAPSLPRPQEPGLAWKPRQLLLHSQWPSGRRAPRL
eukprot:8104773-Alexandrium_andersonii.AAC.2